jgi:hypothetical protein
VVVVATACLIVLMPRQLLRTLLALTLLQELLRMDAFEPVRYEYGLPYWRRCRNSNAGVPPGVLLVFVAAETLLAMLARRQGGARCSLCHKREQQFCCSRLFLLVICSLQSGACVVWNG